MWGMYVCRKIGNIKIVYNRIRFVELIGWMWKDGSGRGKKNKTIDRMFYSEFMKSEKLFTLFLGGA